MQIGISPRFLPAFENWDNVDAASRRINGQKNEIMRQDAASTVEETELSNTIIQGDSFEVLEQLIIIARRSYFNSISTGG